MTLPQEPSSERSHLPSADVTRLLELGVEGAKRPVDELIDRLLQTDGHRWLARNLEIWPIAAFGSPQTLMCEGQATLDQLDAIKGESKDLLSRAHDRDARLAAVMGYFFAVAAALAHHGRLISSRPRRELDPILQELAEVTPKPWSQMLARATLAPDPAEG